MLGRRIINAFAGRFGFKESELDFSDIGIILKGLDPKIVINLIYSTRYREDFRKTPKEIVDFLRTRFQPSESYFRRARHSVFSGKNQRHYIDLEEGPVVTEGKEKVTKRATLDYVV